MKKSISLLCILIYFTADVDAQSNYKVSISGDTCTSALLTANATGGNLAALLWYYDTIPVVLRTAKSYTREGIIISTISNFGYYSHMCFDQYNNLYVAESNYNQVTKWAPGDTVGIVVAGGHGAGSKLNQLSFPHGITVDSTGNIYIADALNDRVMKWAPGAKEGAIVANKLKYTYDVAVDHLGNLYVCDQSSNNVTKWKPGELTGAVVAQVTYPTGICLDDAGNLYVTDNYNYRVLKFVPGDIYGETVAGGENKNLHSIYHCSPEDIIVGKEGRIFVLNGDSRVVVWEPKGKYGATIIGAHGYGFDMGEYINITAFAMNKDGDIATYDPNNYRLQKYTPAPPGYIDDTFKPIYAYDTGKYRVKAFFRNGATATSRAVYINTIPHYPYIYGPDGGVCGPATYTYETNADQHAISYKWVAPAGTEIITGQGTSKIRLSISADFISGNLTAYAINTCGSSSNVEYIKGKPNKASNIRGAEVVPDLSVKRYSAVSSNGNTYYEWIVPTDAKIIAGQGTDTMVVQFGTQSGNIGVTPKTNCGIAKQTIKYITVGTAIKKAQEINTTVYTPIVKDDILIYPQPVASQASIRFYAAKTGSYKIILGDVSGKVLLFKRGNAVIGYNTVLLNLGSLDAGSYYITLSDEKSTRRIKFIKE